MVQPERVEAESATEDVPQYVAAAPREIVVGDKVKLRSFGSVGIVDQIKDGMAEVRVKSFNSGRSSRTWNWSRRRRVQNHKQGKLEKLRRSANTEIHLAEAEQKAQIGVERDRADD